MCCLLNRCKTLAQHGILAHGEESRTRHNQPKASTPAKDEELSWRKKTEQNKRHHITISK